MSINIKRYIDITSGVGGAPSVQSRELIGRIVTLNAALPAGTIGEFTTLDDVGNFFGYASEEYKRAVKYFGFVNKSTGKPKKLSFISWAKTAAPPSIVGDTSFKSLPSFTPVSAGTLVMTQDGVDLPVTGINLSAAVDLAAVATAVQTAIRAAATASGSLLNQCTVTYVPASTQFNLVGNPTVSAGVIMAKADGAADVSALLGWSTPGHIDVPGHTAQTVSQAIAQSAAVSDNFGSFSYIPVLTNNEMVEVGSWNHAQNNKYIYCALALRSSGSVLFPLLKGFSGLALHLVPSLSDPDYVENCPMEILAATNYSKPAASQNYMYYQFGNRGATVFTDADADAVDALRGNYMGQTQTAGQKISFYQTGVLMGDSTAALDMNTYANEMWLKDRLTSDLLSMFLALPSVSANDVGRSQLLAIVQDSLVDAKTNGTISVGKALNATQKGYIGQVTGDLNAWQQVQTLGYWIDVELVSYVVNGVQRWKGSYTLVYSKDDQIRSVSGNDVMI